MQDPFLPRYKKYTLRMHSKATKMAFSCYGFWDRQSLWYCPLMCVSGLTVCSIMEVATILIAIFGICAGVLVDMCTGRCHVPCIPRKFAPAEVEWL